MKLTASAPNSLFILSSVAVALRRPLHPPVALGGKTRGATRTPESA